MPRKRRPGVTYTANCGCGDIFVTCNDIDGKLSEVFIKLGKAGGCANAIMTCTGVLISQALKCGVPLDTLILSLDGLGCHTQPNCLSEVGKVLALHKRNLQAEVTCTE